MIAILGFVDDYSNVPPAGTISSRSVCSIGLRTILVVASIITTCLRETIKGQSFFVLFSANAVMKMASPGARYVLSIAALKDAVPFLQQGKQQH